MTILPKQRLNYPNILFGSQVSHQGMDDEEGCGIDPETGEYTCTGRVKKSPEPDKPGPNDPPPEEESEPTQPPQVDRAFLVALFSMFTDAITSALAKPLTNFNYQPLQLPARPRPSLHTVEPPPLRAIPAPEPLLSNRLSPVVRDTLQTLHNQYQARLAEKLRASQQNAQRGGEIARGIVEASNASLIPNNQQNTEQAAIVYELPQTPQNPAAAQALQDLFNSRASQPNWLIQEDSGWIQANIAQAGRPVQLQEQMRAAQEAVLRRQQLEAQQAYYQAQIELAQTQRQAIELQNRANYQAVKQLPELIAPSGEIMTDVPDTLIAESGSVSLRYKAPKFGERATGPKSNFPPKPIYYNNDRELSDKLWYHFLNGQGQPVEINMAKLDFSNDINMPKLFSAQLRQYLSNPSNLQDKNSKAVIESLSGKKLENGFPASNGKVAYIIFKDDFTDVEPNLDKTILPSKFAAFGRLSLDVKDIELIVNYSEQTVTLQAGIYPVGEKGELDRFDFDNDPRRGSEWNLGTEIVHRTAPNGSTSYNILGKGNSRYKRTYKFKGFLK